MLKATLRCAVLLALVAFGMVVTSLPSFAEVQNVKVSGDITVRAFHREDLDLHQEKVEAQDEQDFIMQTTGINVGADLTENVSANIRIANERDWDLGPTAGTLAAAANSSDIDVSQSYITLKELFYAPLTLRIGTQPIVWGRGFILGSGLLPNVNGLGDDQNASISANEFTDFTAFDAIRATLDLGGVAGMPLAADLVYIKFDENSVAAQDDVRVFGLNVGTQFDSMSSELETYYVLQRDENTDVLGATISGATADQVGAGAVSTLGIRGSAKPADGAQVWAEAAYQFGDRTTDPHDLLPAGDSQQAWAFNLAGDYTLGDVATSPKIGAEWRFYSGKNVHGAVGGWDPVAPGYFTTALREFQSALGVAGFYANDQHCFAGGTSGTSNPCTNSSTNQHELALYGSLTPIEDLMIMPRFSWFWYDVGAWPQDKDGARGSKREGYVGMEWDTVVNYNYTDDVQFGFIYALFNPGSAYTDPFNSTAQELITSVSVKF